MALKIFYEYRCLVICILYAILFAVLCLAVTNCSAVTWCTEANEVQLWMANAGDVVRSVVDTETSGCVSRDRWSYGSRRKCHSAVSRHRGATGTLTHSV